MKKFLYIFFTLFLLISCSNRKLHQEYSPDVISYVQEGKYEQSKSDLVNNNFTNKENVINLVAVGDNLIHDSLYNQAKIYSNDKNHYDFSPIYQYVKDIINKADISYFNQETIIAEDLFPVSGYPRFNSPKDLGFYMKDIGFDVVSLSNNHMFDMGEEGLNCSIDFWKNQNLTVIGAFKSESDLYNPIITEINGIKIAWIAMTESTNGLSLPKNTNLRYVNCNEIDIIKKQVKIAKQSADFVIACPHWGVEYSLDSSDGQKDFANYLSSLGVDLILGSHSHTIQPIEWIDTENNKSLVSYSLGNFVGNMLYPENMVSGILNIEIKKDNNGAYISNVKFIPTIIHYEGEAKNTRIYFLKDYTEELLKKHGYKDLDKKFDVIAKNEFNYDFINYIYNKNIPKDMME